MSHTPGPWYIIHGDVIASEVYGIARVRQFCDVAHPERNESEANSRLIAAAPDLIEVCQAIEAALNMPGVTAAEVLDENSPIRDALRAAIAKADGTTA